MARIACFTDQPFFTKVAARWSSSAGSLGLPPSTPKLSTDGTSPRPNRWCQMRLTITRAVKGSRGSVMRCASSRRPLPVAMGGWSAPAIASSSWRGAVSPRLRHEPRFMT